MPYTLSWYKPNLVMHVKITGKFSEEEMFEYPEKIRDEYLPAGKAPVHLIIDIFDIEEYPRNISIIQKAVSIFQQHPSMGWVVLVGFNNPLTRFIANINLQIFGLSFRFAATMEEAIESLTKVDIRMLENNTASQG
jgi:hypothetical protein